MRRLIVLTAMVAPLAGCNTGWPFGSKLDPNAAEAVSASAPLVDQCRREFVAALKGTPVSFDSGPSVTRAGAQTTIRLEAMPTSPDAINPKRYYCDFENGTMGDHGPEE